MRTPMAFEYACANPEEGGAMKRAVTRCRPWRWKSLLLALLAGVVPAGMARAADSVDVAHAITGVRVQAGPGRSIDSATVVIRDGVIEAIGADLAPPADARVFEGEGLTLYAGPIAPYQARSWPSPEGDEGAGATKAPALPVHENPLVRPERDAVEIAGEIDANVKLRNAGFTTALIASDAGLWRGEAVAINLGSGDLGEDLLRRRAVQVGHLAMRGGYPNSLMGSVALMRQTLLDADWYQKAHAAWEADSGQARPPYDLSLEALGPVVRGEHPVLLEARNVTDLLRLSRLVEEFDLDAWIVGNGDEYQYLEQVAATGLPLLLPVDFPSAPAIKDDALDNLGVSLGDLVHWDEAPSNPGLLEAEGVRFAFTAAGLSNPAELFTRIHQAIERGLSPDTALAAVTTVPAELLGIEAHAGTVEVGKMANLLLVDGDLFAEKPKLRAAWVDGRHFELKEVKPPEVNPVGTWKLSLVTGGPQIEIEMVISGSIESLSGTMNAMGNTLPIARADVSGKTLEVAIDSSSMGAPGEIVMRLEIDGDSASGSGDSPMGSFTVSGRRSGGPPGGRAQWASEEEGR